MLGGVIVAIVLIPALLTVAWFVQIVAGCIALRRRPSAAVPIRERTHSTAVLIPAHNEGAGLLPTLDDVRAQVLPQDRILVVADNCSDDTAEVARAAGAEVVVRQDPERRGKGYALGFGVKHLAADPPDVVVILDADCRLDEGALGRLSQTAMRSDRPVQALYLMLHQQPLGTGQAIAMFAWRIKNWLRPLGLRALGLPTLLFGTGMAFPHRLLEGRDLGNSRLAEDTALGLALAEAGRPPMFVAEAGIHSHFPVSGVGTEQQRQRWEKGHLENIMDLVPGALARSILDRNLGLAALAVDMAIPPLSLLVLVTLAFVVSGGVAFALGGPAAALMIPVFSLLLVLLGTAAAWLAMGRDLLPVRSLLRLPLHPLEKLLFYQRIATGRAPSTWIRTERK